MTSRDDRIYDGLDRLVDPEDFELEDPEDDELVVPVQEHAEGTLQSGSRFGRHAAAAPLVEEDEPDGLDVLPDYLDEPEDFVDDPDGLDVSPASYAAPQPPQTVRARQVYVDPDANRAAFDARYGEDAYGADPYAAPRQDRGGFLKRHHKQGEQVHEAPATYQAYDAREAAARPRRRRREHTRRAHPVRRVLLTLIAVLAVVYAVVCVPIDRSIAFDEAEGQSVREATQMRVPFMPYYVLLMGSDARDGDTVSRTDTMMLARIDVVRNQITLVSIPRDTMVQIEGHGTQKINAAYAFGGAGGAVSAVSELTGTAISEAAVIRFDGVATLVDAIGGITVDVPVEVNDPDYTGLVLPAGPTQMDGQTALLFSRVRHGFALGDFQRQVDQALVIQAIIDKVRTLPPTQLPQVAASMGDLLDTSMRCYDIVPILVRMLAGGPTIYRASVPSTTEYVDGVSYVIADQAALAQMMATVDAGGDPSTVANGLS
ncbi:MAG: LCP family protein [Olegusella sp.]|nr:LCP family protein [Olegusella sp.]